MMYRVLDNKDGGVIAIVFSEDVAKHVLTMFDDNARVPGDEETIRYVYEDCFQNGPGSADQIGDTLAQLGRNIQFGRHVQYDEP